MFSLFTAQFIVFPVFVLCWFSFTILTALQTLGYLKMAAHHETTRFLIFHPLELETNNTSFSICFPDTFVGVLKQHDLFGARDGKTLSSYGDFHIWIAIILFIIGGVLLFSAELRIQNVGLVHLFCLLSAFFQAVQKIQHFNGTSFNTLSFTTSFQNYLFELNFSDKSISFLNKVKQMLRHLYLFNDFSKRFHFGTF